MKYNITIFLSVLSLALLISSCSSTKFVPENKFLLVKNAIELNGDKASKDKLNPYITQKPNIKSLKLPFGLWFYGWGNKDFEQKWDDKITKYRDSIHFPTKVFSLKQTVGWANFNKDLNRWYFKNGEAPVLLNSKKTKKSAKNLALYYIDQGFFKAKIGYKIDTLSENKAKVTYKIDTDKAFKIDTIKYQIASPILDSLIRNKKSKSYLKTGEQFKREDFEKEADRLTKLFRNAGVYHFSKFSINFREIDSTNQNYKTNVVLEIADRVVEEIDSLVSYPYEISTIKEVKIYTDYSYLQRNSFLKDSIRYNGLDFYAYNKIDYKPNLIALSIFIKPGQRYSDTNNDITRQNLRDLNGFSSIKINYEEIANNQLIAHILLTPSKQYSLKLEGEWTHTNIKPFGISSRISYSNNNALKRNEILQIAAQGSFLNSTEFSQSAFLNAWELGVDASYKIPRFLFPFNKEKSFLRQYAATTTFTLGSSLQKNIGLDKQRFTAIAEYDWKASPKTNHRIEVLNAQFIKNLNAGSFFDVYKSEFTKLESIQSENSEYFPIEELVEDNALSFLSTALENEAFQQNNEEAYLATQNIQKRYNIITEDVLVPAITYQLTYNTQRNFKDTNFSFLRAQIASSGLLSSVFAENTNSENPKQILGINIAQYVKLDLEFRKHWSLNLKNVLAFRANAGVAIPYANSASIPFSRSYFAGGPNDIRAWSIYELGPGSEDSGLEFNVGNLKLLSNLEYRFDIISSFKGALFIDAGNIWDTTNSDLTSDAAKFDSFSSLKDIAIGSGFGLRYDFSFLVFRADVGFKTYEPYLTNGNKWFQNYNFKNSVLNIGINYPF